MRFHECIVKASCNRVLLAQFRALRFVLQPLLAPDSTLDVTRSVIRSHRSPLSAIAAGDAAEAGRLMRLRVAAVRAKVLAVPGPQGVPVKPVAARAKRPNAVASPARRGGTTEPSAT